MDLVLSFCSYSIDNQTPKDQRGIVIPDVTLYCFKTLLYLLFLVCQAGCKFSQWSSLYIFEYSDLLRFLHKYVFFLSKELLVNLRFTGWNARRGNFMSIRQFVEEIGEVYSNRL